MISQLKQLIKAKQSSTEEVRLSSISPILLKSAAKEYKIHLMPKNGYMQTVVNRLQNAINNSPRLQNSLAQYKVLLSSENEGGPNLLKKEKGNDGGIYPRIAIYAENKKDAQIILDEICALFPEKDAAKFGDNITPRLNRKVNPLIYYAQSSADIKNKFKEAGLAEKFDPDMVHFKEDHLGQHTLEIPK